MTRGPFREVTLPPPPAPEWTLPIEPDPEAVGLLARELSLPPSLCGLLVARRVLDPESAKQFLRPRLEDLHPPGDLKDLERAVSRVGQAVSRGETVLVHGDYDVDGVCAAALLTLWIRRLGGSAVPFVPHRVKDGYDLGPAGLRAAERAGASVLVTCDSGILAHDAVEEASSMGLDVIVTDHHAPGARLPPAVAVVNPNRHDCDYPFSDLSGTGVVFKLCQGLARAAGIPAEELWPHLDLVALATVADLVPLRGENRTLTRFGLRYLARTTKPGLQALLRESKLEGQAEIDAGRVGFVLAPRINAAGRVDDADVALRLLLTEDAQEAGRLARHLEEANTRRKEEDRATLDDALVRLAEVFDPGRDFGVVLEGEGWHPGVIGIVASRLVERIHRPVVLVTFEGDTGRGSARSVPGVHVLDAIRAGADHLTRFGGHRQAAGLDLEMVRLPAFREAFNTHVRKQLGGKVPRPRVGGDLTLPLADANDDLHRLLRYLGPFGIGNPRPVFCARGLELAGRPREVGSGHLKLRLADGGHQLEAIGFGLARRMPPEQLGDRIDALFQLRENEYRGVRTLQARLVDVRPSEADGDL